MQDSTKVIHKILKDLEYLKKRQLRINKLIVDLKYELQNACEHQSTSKDVKHYEGGYDYAPSETTTISCDVCGFVLSTNTINC